MAGRDSPSLWTAARGDTASAADAADSAFDVGVPVKASPSVHPPSRRTRRAPLSRRSAAIASLLVCLVLLVLLRGLVGSPYIDATLRTQADGSVTLVSSPLADLNSHKGAQLSYLVGADGSSLTVDEGILLRSPRWTVDDTQRMHLLQTQQRLALLLQQGPVTLHFADGADLRLQPAARGLAGLGSVFWLTGALALAMALVAAAVMLAHRHWRNLPYLLIGLCQAANLLAIGIEALPGLGLPYAVARHGLEVRVAFDLFSAAAMVNLTTLQPLRLPRGRWIAATTWLVGAGVVTGVALWPGQAAWWWTQAGVLGCGLLTIGLMSWSYRLEPNPFAVLMRRLACAATATLALLSLAVAVAGRHGGIALADAAFSSVIWYLFLATLILLLPVFSRAQPLMRELALLAGTSTVATSLNLLFLAIFSIGAFASLSLSVSVALAVYAATRQWLLRPMSGQQVPGAERLFERLHRVLRDVEARPRESAELLTRLLRDLFEPLDATHVERNAPRSRVLGNGSALLVPVPVIDADRRAAVEGSIVLRFAERGKRMFSYEDARLTDRVVDQLRRAVAYDKAVERGRAEERLRIAQDLHDDIGARLLTLMYKAQSPEMEDYLRHTLKDLKTLTRGLAANDQHLSHATAEWKTDIAQRLGAAQMELSWSFNFDRDIVLSVVQWSALTRVLRELVSNTIQHSCATHVDIVATLQDGRLRLSLADDGIGREPQAWSHGLGLGGVRKRVKLLGGDVQWRENGRAGIVCTVLVPHLDPRAEP